ncbi:MAG: riboflavin synthase [Bacteroidota bacterium]
MFTGIIENIGIVKDIIQEKSNIHFYIESSITSSCKIDESIAHNGVCLTIVDIQENIYKVTAVDETLQKTNLKYLQVGHQVNLERAMQIGNRFDGHIVQGHVDDISTCLDIQENQGSWIFTFSYTEKPQQIIVEKGSICVNGISLTAFEVTDHSFKVAIIPYTYEHTNLNQLKMNDIVNLEFDILGKYLAKMMKFKL